MDVLNANNVIYRYKVIYSDELCNASELNSQ